LLEEFSAIMTRKESLQSRLKNVEDRFTERKPPGASTEDICKTLVAFANSLSDGEEGILFIGISDKGDPIGVPNTDKRQKDIRRYAEDKCYPSIPVQCEVIEESGVQVIAVTVYPSYNRPHFAGPAYVRIGSESVKVSKELFETLITSRNDKARRLLQEKAQDRSVVLDRYLSGFSICKIVDCNPHFVRFCDERTNEIFSAPIERIYLSWDGKRDLLFVAVQR
jgi:predicted HTH transcriptional regulator